MKHSELLLSSIGACIATLLASFFSDSLLAAEGLHVLLASTGASALIIFGMPFSPVARPWNLVGGHCVSAIVGIACYKWIPYPVVGVAVATGGSMVAMGWCRCMHPPGAATAISAIIGGEAIHHLGFAFVVVPVMINSIILLSVAMAVATFRERNPFYDD